MKTKIRDVLNIVTVNPILILIYVTACHSEIKTIHFEFHKISSEQLSKYSSLRDVPLTINHFRGLPFYLLLKALGAKLNVSNIVTKNWYAKNVRKNLTSDITQYDKTDEVTIVTQVSILGTKPWNVKYQWEQFQSSHHKPIFFAINDVDWTFVYCDLPRWKKEPIWSFKILTNVFDNATWLSIAATTLLTTFTLGPEKFGSNFILLISSILCMGLSGRFKQQNLILVVWLSLIRVLVDMYSGIQW